MNRERTYPNFMEFNIQTEFSLLVSKFIYSWKNKAFGFKTKRFILKGESTHTLQHVNDFSINESEIYGLNFLLKIHGW